MSIFFVCYSATVQQKRIVSKVSMQYSTQLGRIVFCDPKNIFLDAQLGFFDSDKVGLIFNQQPFANQSKCFISAFIPNCSWRYTFWPKKSNADFNI